MNDIVVVHKNISDWKYNRKGYDYMSLYNYIEGFDTEHNYLTLRDLHIVANFIDYMGYHG